MASSMSIEETNRIRVSVGLPPLPVPGAATGPTFKESAGSESDSDVSEEASTLETREAAGYTNWKKLQDEAEAKKQRDARSAAIRKAREAAQKFAKIEGKSLGDLDEGEELDTKSWLLGQKKRQRKLEKERARKLAEELAERERIAEYTAADLAGVKVGHEMGEFGDGEQILTLKDTTIDENEEEGDELENMELREHEKLKEKLDLKRRRPVYDPNAVDEDGKSKILAQYDEEIEGKKRKRFTLDGQGTTAEERQAKRQDVSERLKAQSISLDILHKAPKSDYMDVSEVRVKKPKKKKAKSTRRREADEDDIFPLAEEVNGNGVSGDSMEVDGASQPFRPKTPAPETSFVDDEDLQASLAVQRLAAFKKRKKKRPEDIARELREEASATPNGDVDGDGAEEEPGLVIDETSEFVENLQRPVAPEPRPRPRSVQPSIEGPPEDESPEEDGDVKMEPTYSGIEDEDQLLARLKREQSTSATPDITATGLEEEATVDKGLGATLNLLKERGLVKTSDTSDLNELHRRRQNFLAEKRRREEDAERHARMQRERDRLSGKLDRMSAREREEYARWENKQRDQQESREMAAIFNKEYKPDVQLKYVDDFGRSMNQKEAFKHLSHQFHGKGSGKQKTEKHLKKIEEEKKRMAQSTLDSSSTVGLNNAMGATQRKNRQAGVRLG